MFRRNFKECSPNLADRIIKQSYKIEQKQSLYLNICSFFNELNIPKPELTIPVTFAIGFIISLTLNTSIDMSDFVDSLYLQI